MKKIVVISLGGSVIIPERMNYRFLHKFKRTLRKFYKTHRFVIVCGGGQIARKYINALQHEGKSKKDLSLAGIMATRMNAMFLMKLFGAESNQSLPLTIKQVNSSLIKNNLVICGALRYRPDSTSDSTSAVIAKHLKSPLINITNVSGLYDKDPKENSDALLIRSISWKDFEKMAKKSKFHPGQHFVLDQQAASIIKDHKIVTYIVSNDTKELKKILKQKKFLGTIIS